MLRNTKSTVWRPLCILLALLMIFASVQVVSLAGFAGAQGAGGATVYADGAVDTDGWEYWEDCDSNGLDDHTGKVVPWPGFDATHYDEIPPGWDGICHEFSYYVGGGSGGSGGSDDSDDSDDDPNIFTQVATPRITGTLTVGNALSANVGTWSDSPSFAYQWYRSGNAVSGATASSYKLVKSDIGKKITVKITASKTGYESVSTVSAATTKIKGVFSNVKKPTISGKAKVGKTLKAKIKTVSPKATIKYRWYAGGKAIKGATKATFKLKKAQKGKKITVKITYTKTNYVKVVATSKATAKVKK